MPAHVPAVEGEAALLAAYINQQIDGIRTTAYALAEDEARTTTTASSLTIAGLMSHVATCVSSWLDKVEAAPERVTLPKQSEDEAQSAWMAEWHPQQTVQQLDEELQSIQRRVESVAAASDMDAPVPVPDDAPWWPKDVESWQTRWVFMHLIEEVARHAGHADIIRESFDGATMYELMAAVDGWSTPGFLEPWTRERTDAAIAQR